MKNLGERIQGLRKAAGLTQNELAKKIDISMTQLVRYENKGVQPPADVLRKTADTLNVSIDFLINGTTEEKAKGSLKDVELLNQFKAVDAMNEKDKNTIKDIIDAFIKRSKLHQIIAV